MAGVDHAVQRQIIALATKSAENPYCTINMQIFIETSRYGSNTQGIGPGFHIGYQRINR
jgi:hypothetical protein